MLDNLPVVANELVGLARGAGVECCSIGAGGNSQRKDSVKDGSVMHFESFRRDMIERSIC